MSFQPGDEVVCVGRRPGDPPPPPRAPDHMVPNGRPKVGSHYIVRQVRSWPGTKWVVDLLLVEIVNPKVQTAVGCVEIGWTAYSFRPVKRESIEIFRQMCVSTKPLVDINP